MSLMAEFVDGKFNTETASSASLKNAKEDKNKSGVDSEAFLTLLVAEMQNQDPLEPTSNTEWVSQYATFTQVSEIQAIGDRMNGVQAQSLVGKNVIMRVTDSTGDTNYIDGMVERVGYEDGKAYLYIDGNPYSVDDLDTVISEKYMAAQEKVDQIRSLIKKLPSMQELTIGDQDTVMELGKILSGMSDYEKNFVEQDAIDAINEYGQRMLAIVSDHNAQDAAQTIKEAMERLPAIDEIDPAEHRELIENLKGALDELNDMARDYL
ncbi:MAG: hypothetical protein J6U50_01640, partial [Lachnospiraceae bacterium]|nr:hypothetical protein [Lachnospiraceae bacterium]